MTARRAGTRNTPKSRRRRTSRRPRRIAWRPIARSTGIATAAVGALVASWWTLPRAWHAVRAHPYFAVSEITLRGNVRIGRELLLHWAGVHPGISIWEADPVTVGTRLLEHPDLTRVLVRRDFPRRLVISLHERTPMAIAVLDDLYFVDRTGRLMDRLSEHDSRDLPMITGLSLADVTDRGGGPLLRRAARLARLCQREGCGTGISEIHIDARRGVTLIPLHRPVPIMLGWGAWRAKLARTGRVLATWEGRESHVAVLDASVPNQVIVRLRQAPPQAGAPRRNAKPGVRT